MKNNANLSRARAQTNHAVSATDLRLPHSQKGMRIGLFGGSFNPPHAGHVHVSDLALKRAGLDQMWWLVTPGNPLKDHSELAPLGERIALCRELNNDPHVKITAFEAGQNLSYTAQTLARIRQLRPGVKFVWVMGADNLAHFHHWQNWRGIAAMMPILVIDRPGSTLSLRSAQAPVYLARYRLDESDISLLADKPPPVWAFYHGPRSSLSSTLLRDRAKS